MLMQCFARRTLDSLFSIGRLALFGLSLLLIGPLSVNGQFFDQEWNNPGKGNWFMPGIGQPGAR